MTLEEVLEPHRWSAAFRDWYLVPLGSSIWSADPGTFSRIPAATFARFFERHGLLGLRDQPSWRTVTGGSQRYVEAILAPLRDEGRLRLGAPVDKIRRRPDAVELVGPTGPEEFDHVVVATHSDQALRLLSDADSGRTGGPRRHPLPAQPSHPAHRHRPDAPHQEGLGQLELPPAGGGERPGHPHLPPQPAPGTFRQPPRCW